MWDSFIAIFRKERLHILRDKGTFSLAVMVPLFQMCMFGFIDQTVRDLPTVVVDRDRSVESRLLVDRLRATGTFEVVRTESDPHAARRAVVDGSARVGVVIPPDFRNQRARGLPAHVQVLIDGSDSTVSSQALAAVNGLGSAVPRRRDERDEGPSGIAFRPTILFNPDGRTANYIIPGLVAIVLQMVAIALAAGAIVREREQGTLEQLLVTPLHPLGLMLGKIAPFLIFGIIEAGLVLSVMRFGFAVPIRGSLLFLLVIVVVYLIALLAMGLFISTVARTREQAGQLTQLIAMPSVFLSGYVFPTAGLPLPLYVIGQLLPPTHMVAIMRGIVLRDASPMQLWPHVLALLVMSALLVWGSVRRFRSITV
jgi:ABC-2 type transport system permease protein